MSKKPWFCGPDSLLTVVFEVGFMLVYRVRAYPLRRPPTAADPETKTKGPERLRRGDSGP
jgi:hypothetical protein